MKIKFQRIPTDFTVEQRDVEVRSKNRVKFASYTNNLNPENESSKSFYPVLENLLNQFIPLFEKVLLESPLKPSLEQVKDSWKYDPPKPDQKDNEEYQEFAIREQEWGNTRRFIQPLVKPFKAPAKTGACLAVTTLQVIVKLASVELTPEKPEFEGGSWHVEGE